MKNAHGFTLLELMVVLAVMAIIASIGLPGLQDFVANNKLLTSANNLATSFYQARSEALKRSTTTKIVAKNGDWADGWDITLNGTSIAGTEPLPGNISVLDENGDPPATIYSYTPEGRLQITNNNYLTFCDSRTNEAGRKVTLSPIGRVSVESITCN